MGAALTYARRYALFTLVGIAGEDDLDAPDLDGVDERTRGATNGVGKMAVDGQGTPPRSSGNGHARGAVKGNVVDLAPDRSVALRDRLLSEIASITEADKAATWARGVLAAKNSLQAADARLVEDAFEQRLSAFSRTEGSSSSSVASNPEIAETSAVTEARDLAETVVVRSDQAKGIDKSALTIATPRRYRNKAHLRYVAHQPCLLCGRKPSDAHHLRFVQPRALGRKVSDEFAVPLCRIHHRLLHRVGNESAWWQEAGIDPIKAAGRLWQQTRLVEDRSESKDTKEAAPNQTSHSMEVESPQPVQPGAKHAH